MIKSMERSYQRGLFWLKYSNGNPMNIQLGSVDMSPQPDNQARKARRRMILRRGWVSQPVHIRDAFGLL